LFSQALGESKGLFSSNPFSGLGDKLSGAVDSATGNAKDLASDVTGSNPLGAAKNAVDSTADRVSGAADKAQGEVKAQSSKLPLGFAGLNEKVSGAAKEAGANVRDAASDVTGANPIDAGKNAVGQAADKASGSAKEVRKVFLTSWCQERTNPFDEHHTLLTRSVTQSGAPLI
jgi:uncharacterized protein YjbJ (UPF0337 family)